MTLHTLAKWNSVTFRAGRLSFDFFPWGCIIQRNEASSIAPKHLVKERDRKAKSMEDLAENGWIKTSHFKVFPWSVSGVESCVVVRNSEVSVAFDMGYTFPDAVRCSTVLISHGHIDHTSGIIQHASKRSLYSMPVASYYMPHHIVEPLKKISQLYNQIHNPSGKEDVSPMNLNGMGPGDTVKINAQWVARPFPTCHRVQSQGYILYKQQKKLKKEYQGLPGPEIGQLVRSGADVHQYSEVPVLAYTGDTTFDLFLNPPTKDLFEVDTLITEATYIDGGVESIRKAQERGHSHLLQFVEHEHLFQNINSLIFVHFSDKYSTGYIQRTCSQSLTQSLASKVHLGIQCKLISERIQHKK